MEWVVSGIIQEDLINVSGPDEGRWKATVNHYGGNLDIWA